MKFELERLAKQSPDKFEDATLGQFGYDSNFFC